MKRNKIPLNVWALLLFSLVFGLVYMGSLSYASSLHGVPSYAFSFEKYIPFLPWTIIPYLSSGFFFCYVFLQIHSREELFLYLKRLLFITIVAGICFFIFPLQYSVAKPDVPEPTFRLFFWLLHAVDDPYNQAPSLHVALAFAFWTVLGYQHSKWRYAIAGWLILVGLSTLTTFQHHIIDLLAGSVLAHLSFVIFPRPEVGFRNRHVANFIFLSAWLTVSAAFLLAEFYDVSWLNLFWLAGFMFAAGYQLQRNSVYLLKLLPVNQAGEKSK